MANYREPATGGPNGGIALHTMHMADRRLPMVRGTDATAPRAGTAADESRQCGASDVAGELPSVEAVPTIDPAIFERLWVDCEPQTRHLRTTLRAMPSEESIETALGQQGMVCIASGTVGPTHKWYFAAELTGRAVGNAPALFMLELMANAETRPGHVTVLASFRCAQTAWLRPLSERFGKALSRVVGEDFVVVPAGLALES